jgi:hypothetical protein
MSGNVGQFTKAQLSQAYKRKSIIRFRGDKFYSLRAAERYTKRSEGFLNDHKRGSPLLDGRDMRLRPFKDGSGQEREYFAQASLDELIKAVEQLPVTPVVPDYCSYEEAPAIAGASLDTVKDLKKKGSKRFKIKKFKEKKVLAKDNRGHVIWKRYLPIAPLKRYRECCENAVVPKDKMTVVNAAKFLDVAKVTVIAWIRKGILPKSKDQLVPGGVNGDIQNGFLLDRKVVETFGETRKKEPQPFVDARGKWYPERSAEEKYPNAKGYMLRRYRNKPCPRLNRDILNAQQIPWPEGMRKNNHVQPWGYLDKDLERLTLAGEPGPNLNGQSEQGNGRSATTMPAPMPAPTNRQQEVKNSPKRRGRKKGWRSKTAAIRNGDMIAAWKTGKYDTPTDLGRAFDVDPSFARKLIRSLRSAGK